MGQPLQWGTELNQKSSGSVFRCFAICYLQLSSDAVCALYLSFCLQSLIIDATNSLSFILLSSKRSWDFLGNMSQSFLKRVTDYKENAALHTTKFTLLIPIAVKPSQPHWLAIHTCFISITAFTMFHKLSNMLSFLLYILFWLSPSYNYYSYHWKVSYGIILNLLLW